MVVWLKAQLAAMKSELARIADVQRTVWIRNERKKRHRLLLTQLLFEYTQNSTLHGVRYMTERTLHAFEKVFWAVMVVASGALCAYFISNVFEKWTTSPIIVSVGERMIPASSIPFPAVTICPQIKSKATVYNFYDQVKNMKNMNTTELEDLVVVNSLCSNVNSQLQQMASTMSNVSSNFKIRNLINKISPHVEETIHCPLCPFTNSYTWEGLCFTYNNVAAKELFREDVEATVESTLPSMLWSVEEGYEPNSFDRLAYPKRSRDQLFDPVRSIMLINDRAYADPICYAFFSGYTIYLSHPADVPQTPVYHYAALHGQITSLAITAHIFTSSKSLKKYPVEKRQCYFPDEVQLRYFKHYTLNNCQLECFTNNTRRFCGCVTFYMPRLVNDTVPVCLNARNKCVSWVEWRMVTVEEIPEKAECRCLPLCDYITYDAEVLKTEFKIEEFFRASSTINSNFRLEYDKEYSGINVFFKQNHFIAIHRSELFGVTDLIANIGGLLGVFLGFSFLSLIEIFYFLFVRIGFTLKRDLEEEKQAIH